MCKRGNTFSLAVLIGRGLDHNLLGSRLRKGFRTKSAFALFSFQGIRPLYAPLAQLVEHLTLNQGVPGSSP